MTAVGCWLSLCFIFIVKEFCEDASPFQPFPFFSFHIFLVVYGIFTTTILKNLPPPKNEKQTPFHMETTTSKHQKTIHIWFVYITREKPTKTRDTRPFVQKQSKTRVLGCPRKLVKGSWVITPRYSHL